MKKLALAIALASCSLAVFADEAAPTQAPAAAVATTTVAQVAPTAAPQVAAPATPAAPVAAAAPAPADLETLIQVAITSQQPLFLCLRGPAAMAQENPALLQAVTNDPRWQRLPSVLGMEAMLSYDLYRFAPESIGRLQLNP